MYDGDVSVKVSVSKPLSPGFIKPKFLKPGRFLLWLNFKFSVQFFHVQEGPDDERA